MKRLIKIFFLAFVILGIFYVLNLKYSILEHFYLRFIESGNMALEIKSPKLQEKEISIYQKKNDYLIKNGEIANKYLSSYGWSCFLISYEDLKFCEVCYFKKNNKNVNDHIFTVDLTKKDVDLKLNIKGKDSNSKMFYKFFKNDSIYNLDQEKKLISIFKNENIDDLNMPD